VKRQLVVRNQGDQIGLIFAYRVNVYEGLVFDNLRSSILFWASFSMVKVMLTKNILGDFFTNSFGHPVRVTNFFLVLKFNAICQQRNLTAIQRQASTSATVNKLSDYTQQRSVTFPARGEKKNCCSLRSIVHCLAGLPDVIYFCTKYAKFGTFWKALIGIQNFGVFRRHIFNICTTILGIF
jgi:hypothetical protein